MLENHYLVKKLYSMSLGRIYVLATIYFQDLTSTNNIKNKGLLKTNEQMTNDKSKTYLNKSYK